MSELERVQKELVRLTERLREVKNRKGAGDLTAPRPAEPSTATRQPVTWHQPERSPS